MKQDFAAVSAMTTQVLEREPESALAMASRLGDGQATDSSATPDELVEMASKADSLAAPSLAQGKSVWQVFFSTFGTIFLAELGDKTQVSTLLMSAEFHRPWLVFLGAGMALISTTLVGVLVGQWLSTRLSPKTLDTAAGVVLALIAVSLLWDVVRL